MSLLIYFCEKEYCDLMDLSIELDGEIGLDDDLKNING